MRPARLFRLALHLLPAELRHKHASAMEALYVREVNQNGDESLRGGSHVTLPTRGQLLRGHAVAFASAFVALTVALLVLAARNWMPEMIARGESATTIARMLLLSVPFTAALTIPMAVFIAVLYAFSRLGVAGVLTEAARVRDGVRRLVTPVLVAAIGVTMLSFIVTAEIVPRANERLAEVLARGSVALSDRSMSIEQLRAAARTVGPASGAEAPVRAVGYEVEVQKKFVLPVSCVLLALAGMVLAFRFPRGGVWLVIGSSPVVFFAYYGVLMAGERFAERLVVSPFVGMWGANVLLFTVSLLLVWRRRAPGGDHRLAARR